MLRNSIYLLASFSLLFTFSCRECIEGSGSPVDEQRTVQNFEEVVLNSSANLVLNPVEGSDPLKVNVSAQENLLPFIKTTVNGKKLVIDIEGCISSTEKIELTLDVRSLKRITNNGSGDISAEAILKSDEVAIDNDGSGDIDLELDSKNLSVMNDGSGDITLEGDSDNLVIENDGSGNINAFELKTNSSDVKNNGSGDIEIYVRETLKSKLSGSGDITYKGNPQNIDQERNGSGSFAPKN